MSFDKPLPPVVFGEEPKYVAIRLDTPDIRASLASSGLHAMANYPSQWTYLTTAEALAKLNAQPQDVAKGECNVGALLQEVEHINSRAHQLKSHVDSIVTASDELADFLRKEAK